MIHTFDPGYEFAGGCEDFHSVQQRVGADDLPQHTQHFTQTLMGHWPLHLLTWGTEGRMEEGEGG